MTTPERCGAVAVIRNGLIRHRMAPDFAVDGRDVRLTGGAGRAWIACGRGSG